MSPNSAIDDATLIAFLDGELAPDRAAEIEAALATDPGLAERMARHQRLGLRLRGALDAVLDAPVPAPLRQRAEDPAADAVPGAASGAASGAGSGTGSGTGPDTGGGAEIVVLQDYRRPVEPQRAAARPWVRWAGGVGLVAASVLVVVAIAPRRAPPPTGGFEERGGRLVATGAVAHALDVQLASMGAVAGLRVQLTFRNHAGDPCRTFTSPATAGLACREGGAWAIKAIFGGQPGDAASGFRMASGGDPRLMRQAGDMMEGDPLDAVQERTAAARHWMSETPPAR